MPSGKRIPPEVKLRVLQKCQEKRKAHQTVNAKMVAQEVQVELQERQPETPPDWPGVSAVRKIIASLHKDEEAQQLDPEQRPWSLLAMSFVDIDANALPMMLRVWARSIAADYPLTIRQARWVNRLYRLNDNPDAIWGQSQRLADLERMVGLFNGYPSSTDGAEWVWTEDYTAYSSQEDRNDLMESLHRVMVRAFPPVLVSLDEAGEPKYEEAPHPWERGDKA